MKKEDILILDIGNSRVKWAVYTLIDRQYKQHGVFENSSDVDVMLERVFSVFKPMPIWISRVGKAELASQVEGWFRAKWGVNPTLVQVKAEEFGVVNGYEIPEKMGVDRWMAIIAGWQYYKRAFCVIDCGTAITVDCVNNEGVHLGGVIMPGVKSTKKALIENTTIENMVMTDCKLLAGDTEDAVSSGVWHAVCGGVTMILNEVRSIVPEFKICLCGGDALYLESCLNVEAEVMNNLVIEGVCMVALANDA